MQNISYTHRESDISAATVFVDGAELHLVDEPIAVTPLDQPNFTSLNPVCPELQVSNANASDTATTTDVGTVWKFTLLPNRLL